MRSYQQVGGLGTPFFGSPTAYRRGSSSAGGGGGGTGAGSGLLEYLRRVVDPNQMDFDAAFEDILMLCSSHPQRMYKMASYRKHTKNHWARDDPALAVVQIAFLVASSLAYALAFHVRGGPVRYLLLALRAILFDWLVVGLVVATACRWVANRYLLQQRSHSVEQEVEWRYAFDIHCNAFLPFFLLTSVLHYFFLPLLLRPSLMALIASNALFAIAFALYFYVTHLGYRALPFLHRTQVFLYPSSLAVVLFFLFLVLGMLGEPYRFQATRVIAQVYYR